MSNLKSNAVKWTIAAIGIFALVVVFAIWRTIDQKTGGGFLSGALRGALVFGGIYFLWTWAKQSSGKKSGAVSEQSAPLQSIQQPTYAAPIATNTTPVDIAPTAPAPVDEDAIYTAIAQELETGSTDKGLWTRLFAHCAGDENATKARYITERAERLIAAERARLEQIWREESARLEAERFDRIRREGLELRERIRTRDFTPETADRLLALAGSDESMLFLNGIKYAEPDTIKAMLVAEPLLIAVSFSDGSTPLHLAVAEKNPKTVQLLLENGAIPDFANKAGMTPIDLANKLGQIEIAKMLSAMSS